MKKLKLKRRTKILLVVGVLLLLFVAYQLPWGRYFGWRLVVSKETTFITEPLLEDGRVDYLAALNDRLGRGVTAEENAFVALAQVFDFGVTSSPELDEKLKELTGASDLRPTTPLTELFDYFETHYPVTTEEERKKRMDGYEAVMTRPWTRDEFPRWAEALDANAAALELITHATHKSKYYYPFAFEESKWTEPSLGMSAVSSTLELSHLRTAARQLFAASMLEMGHGNTQNALEYAHAMRRLSALASQSLTMIEFLTCLAMDDTTSECEKQILMSHALTHRQLAEYRKVIEVTRPDYRLAERRDFDDRFRLLEFLQYFNVYGSDGFGAYVALRDPFTDTPTAAQIYARIGFLIDWNAAMVATNGLYNQYTDILTEKNDRRRLERLDDFRVELDTLQESLTGATATILSLLGPPQTKGKWLGRYGATADILMLSSVSEVRENVNRDLTITAIDLELFKLDRGVYPAKLEELVPGFAKALPLDRFSDATLLYTPLGDGYLLYSVGRDLIDDGGTGDDLVFAMD